MAAQDYYQSFPGQAGPGYPQQQPQYPFQQPPPPSQGAMQLHQQHGPPPPYSPHQQYPPPPPGPPSQQQQKPPQFPPPPQSQYLHPGSAQAAYPRLEPQRSYSEPPGDRRDSPGHHHHHHHHHDRHSRSRSRSRSNSNGRKNRDTFLGAGGGAIIGDAIFPGLGTLGGLLLGGYGGREYAKHRSKSSQPDYRRSHSHSKDGWDPESRTYKSGLIER